MNPVKEIDHFSIQCCSK